MRGRTAKSLDAKRRGREVIADFQLPIVDLIRAPRQLERSAASVLGSYCAVRDRQKEDQSMVTDRARDMGGGLAIGIAVGVALGVAMKNIAVGLAIGIALGVAFSAGFSRKRIK